MVTMGDDGRTMWALELDKRGLPWRAHLIICSETAPPYEVRYAECGRLFTMTTPAMYGWASLPGSRLPLPDADIHCGLVTVSR
jgi:hypothetical protein